MTRGIRTSCDVCGVVKDTEAALFEHQKSAHPRIKSRCRTCKRKFRTEESLRHHLNLAWCKKTGASRRSLTLLFVVAAAACCGGSRCAAIKEGETSSEDKNCNAGMYCETWCTRVKPLNPVSKNGVRVSGQCVNTTAFQPGAFLDGNPSEMDYVSSPNGLTRVFDAPGLRKFWFDDLVKHNNQSSKEGFAYECNYVLENQYGDAGMVDGYVNIIDYFPDNQNNSNPSISMVNTCYQAAGNK